MTRGLPGSGKSTWIKENNLEKYTLCPDTIRLMYSGLKMKTDGTQLVNGDNDKRVWKLLYELLESRMANGDFTVIDATHTSNKCFRRYKQLATEYRYRIYVVDFSDVDKEDCLANNYYRLKHKIVPEEVIQRMSEQMESQNIPSGIKVLSHNGDIMNQIVYNMFDADKYSCINVFGDIHGCNTVLQEALEGGIKDDELYIFLGDYLDRGIENAEVMKFMLSIYKQDNVICLEGNHESHYKRWSKDLPTHSKQFNEHTAIELNQAEISKKDVREFFRRLSQCAYFTYYGQGYFLSHGGISRMVNPLFISTEQIIRGVGKYEDYQDVADSFSYTQQFVTDNYNSSNVNVIQINGHRNIENLPVKVNEYNYNLEGKVEYGGCLRYLKIYKDRIDTFELKNKVFSIPLDHTEKVNLIKPNLFVKVVD